MSSALANLGRGMVVITRDHDQPLHSGRILEALAAGAGLVIVGDERVIAAEMTAPGTVTLELAAPLLHTLIIRARPEVTIEAHYQAHGGRRGYGGRVGKGERKRNRAGRWA